jgi:hypothetical protein
LCIVLLQNGNKGYHLARWTELSVIQVHKACSIIL